MIREYFERRRKQRKSEKLTARRISLVNTLTKPLQELEEIEQRIKAKEGKKIPLFENIVLSLEAANHSLIIANHRLSGSLNLPIKARDLNKKYEDLMSQTDLENRLKLNNANSEKSTSIYLGGWGRSHGTTRCPIWEREWADDYAYGKYLEGLNLGEKLRNRIATYDEFMKSYKDMLLREVGERGYLTEKLGELSQSVKKADSPEKEHCSKEFAHLDRGTFSTYWIEKLKTERETKKNYPAILTKEQWEKYKEENLNPENQ